MTEKDAAEGTNWTDHYWWSADGIRLHARIYGHDAAGGSLPTLCLPGLTRNARDFDAIAPRLAVFGPVACVDFRGRGDSGFARDAMTYVPLTYVQDVVALLDDLQWQRFAAVGTSLGGLVGMFLGATLPGRLAGLALNDVGPELQAEGLDRIRSYVGVGGSQPTWMHAARQAAEVFAPVYPDFAIQDWLRLVHRTHRLTPEGRIVADYDKQIAAPLRLPGGEAGVDLWPAFDAVASLPMLILRGQLSDILSEEAVRKMLDRTSDAEFCEVARVGHAPTLDEEEAVTALLRWRAKLAA